MALLHTTYPRVPSVVFLVTRYGTTSATKATLTIYKRITTRRHRICAYFFSVEYHQRESDKRLRP